MAAAASYDSLHRFWWSTPVRFGVAFLVTVNLVVLILFDHVGSATNYWGLLPLLVFVPLIAGMSLMRKGVYRGMYALKVALHEVQKADIDLDRLVFTSGEECSSEDWSRYRKVVERKDAFLFLQRQPVFTLQLRRLAFFLIPKRTLDPGQTEELRGWIRNAHKSSHHRRNASIH